MKTSKPDLVGITGNIGSGKTTVCNLFKENFGIPIFSSDRSGKELMKSDLELRSQIIEYFGTKVVKNDQIHTPLLASAVFHHPVKMKQLCDLVHPKVRYAFLRWVDQHSSGSSRAPYLINESALLFESGITHQYQWIITVSCPQSERINRVANYRKDLSPKDVLIRDSQQWDEDYKIERSNIIINNNGNKKDLADAIIKTHHQLIDNNPD